MPNEVAAMPYFGRAGRAAHSRRSEHQGIGRTRHSRPPSPSLPGAHQSPPRSTQPSSRWRDMLRSAVDWLWETDAQLNITFVMPVDVSTGTVPSQLTTGHNLNNLPGFESGISRSPSNAIKSRQPFRRESIALIVGDGVSVDYQLTGIPYFDDNSGRFGGYRGTGTLTPSALGPNRRSALATGQPAETTDGTGSSKVRPERNPTTTSDEELQERFASVAHELRTPLNAILGFSSVMKDRHFGDDKGRYQEYGQYIHDSSVHLLDVVNSLVELAMNDNDQQSIRDEAIDVAELAASALRMLGEEAKSAKVSVGNELPAGLRQVRGDRRAVRQILLNLLSNAIKYTPQEGSAGIECEEVLKLTVWDTGLGIAPEDQEKVFERSYRAPEVRLDKPGSGLGLAISRGLARAMGGEITLESEPGQGSRVSLWLSLDRAKSSSPPPDNQR